MGVPWLVMTTRVPALACFVRQLSFAFASRKGAVFSLGSCAVFRMDILQARPHVVTLQLHLRRPNGYSCSLSPQVAPTGHAMEVAHQDPMCHTLVAMAQIAAKDIRLGAQGRLVLPASLRRALSLSAGDALVARADGLDRIVLEKPSAARAGLQERFAKTRGKLDLAGSLIADRRSEARRDAR